MSKVTTAVVDVTPDQAMDWLANHNTHNRNLRELKVSAYARDMESKAWQFNGDPIRFAEDSTLLDGQHRLAAIVRSGTTQQMLVIWGLPRDSQETMDMGVARRFGDQLKLRGEPDPNRLAAIIRRVVIWDATGGASGLGGYLVPTSAEMLAYLDANPNVRRAADVAALAATRRTPLPGSLIGSAYHICARIDTDAAEHFYVTQLVECIGLEEQDPARVLLIRASRDLAEGAARISGEDAFRYIILTWNHYRAGTKLTKLQAPKGGWTAENSPKPR